MAVPLIGDDSESFDEAVMTVGLSAACARWWGEVSVADAPR